MITFQSAANVYVLNVDPVSATTVVSAYPASATGSATPSSTLTLPSGFIGYSLAIGPGTGILYVAGIRSSDQAGQIYVYPTGATGHAAPNAVFLGNTNRNNGTTFTVPQLITVNTLGQLFVLSQDNSIEVFSSDATATSAPSQYITWGQQPHTASQDNFFNIGGLAADSKGAIYVMDLSANLIDVFAPGAKGNTAPSSIITGVGGTAFTSLQSIAVDTTDNLYVATLDAGTGTTSAVSVLAPGASGSPTPLRTLAGTNSTGLILQGTLALDDVSNLYCMDLFQNAQNNTPHLARFAPTATGTAMPSSTFTPTTASGATGQYIAVY
jgi:hypothetical protein